MTCAKSLGRFVRGVLAPLIAFGCSGTDETRIVGREPQTSRTVAVLIEPESVDTMCRVLGLASRAALGGAQACGEFIERCNGTIDELLGAVRQGSDPQASDPDLEDVDLSPLLGCSVTAADVDACLAGLIERGRDVYGPEVSCEAEALPALDISDIGIAPSCLRVALRCPDLIGLVTM